MLAGIAASIAVGFNILLPVVPVLMERGGPHGAAGAATAALFAGAVASELFTPWLMSRWSSPRLLIAGQLMTAVPSLAYLLPHPEAWLMLAAAAVRGMGMGVAIVVSVVLVGDMAAPDRHGRSIGYFSFALTAPGIVVPSLGIALLDAGRVDLDALIAFIIGVAGALLALYLPRSSPSAHEASANLLAALRRPGLAMVFAGFVLVSSSFGAVITFVPIALGAAGIGSAAVFLFVAGAARAASRWLAGVVGDLRQGRLLLAASIGLTFVGLVAVATRANPPVVIFAALAFGAGYGGVQTGAYLAMTAQGSIAHRHNISALWNSGIDFGSALGGSLLGLAAARYGYGTAIWAIPVVVLIALPLVLAPSGPRPGAEGATAAAPRVESAGRSGPGHLSAH